MFELMFCSLLTILPDYLYRRYAQGKRFGKEITFFSVWYELRWGITGCLMLTISLITMIFYFHPVDDRTRRCTSDRADPARRLGPRRGSQCRLQRAGEEGRRAVQAGQLEAAGGAGDRQAQDRRGRCRHDDGAGRRGQGRRADRGSQGQLSAGQGRTRRQERVAAPQSRHRAAARHREAAGAGRSAAGRRRRRHAPPGSRRRCGFRRSLPAREGERRGGARRRPRSISTRPSSAPASTGASSSSWSAPATSSIS